MGLKDTMSDKILEHCCLSVLSVMFCFFTSMFTSTGAIICVCAGGRGALTEECFVTLNYVLPTLIAFMKTKMCECY